MKGIYALEKYYARDLKAYYKRLTIGLSHNYYLGRVAADIAPWVAYFIEGMETSFAKVYEEAKRAAAAGSPDHSRLLRKLDPKQRKALTLFEKSREVTAPDIAGLFGFQMRTASALCRRWATEGFLVITDPRKNRAVIACQTIRKADLYKGEILKLILIALLAAAPAYSQATLVPSFEAATIRLTAPDHLTESQWSKLGGSIFWATNVTLEFLTAMAYGIDTQQIKSAPPWFASRHFDINAKAEPGVVLSREVLRPRLQSLLQQRFHLTVHHQTIDAQGFALIVAKNGPKLTDSKGDQAPNFRVDVGLGKLRGSNWSMEFCALMLVPKMGMPVVDRTGLRGRYDIDVEYAPDMSQDSPLPALTTALQTQLGLKLVPQKVPVDVFVIDYVDELPTDN